MSKRAKKRTACTKPTGTFDQKMQLYCVFLKIDLRQNPVNNTFKKLKNSIVELLKFAKLHFNQKFGFRRNRIADKGRDLTIFSFKIMMSIFLDSSIL